MSQYCDEWCSTKNRARASWRYLEPYQFKGCTVITDADTEKLLTCKPACKGLQNSRPGPCRAVFVQTLWCKQF